jgi:hypothetical protein
MGTKPYPYPLHVDNGYPWIYPLTHHNTGKRWRAGASVMAAWGAERSREGLRRADGGVYQWRRSDGGWMSSYLGDGA